jgi:hypothetical protein
VLCTTVAVAIALFVLPRDAHAVIVDDPVVTGSTVERLTDAGWEGDLYRTVAQGVGHSEVNHARWSAALPVGEYEVAAFVPGKHNGSIARYTIASSDGPVNVQLDQSLHANQWVALAYVHVDGSGVTVDSTDAGGTAGLDIAWDAIRFTAVESAPPNTVVSGATTIVDDPALTGPRDYIYQFVGDGWADDLFATYSQGATGAPINGAEWTTALDPGMYDVEVFVPSHHATTTVRYVIETANGAVEKEVEQDAYSNAWISLGSYPIQQTGRVRSSDNDGTFGDQIAWDAVRWTRTGPLPAPTGQPQTPASDPTPQAPGAPSSQPTQSPVKHRVVKDFIVQMSAYPHRPRYRMTYFGVTSVTLGSRVSARCVRGCARHYRLSRVARSGIVSLGARGYPLGRHTEFLIEVTKRNYLGRWKIMTIDQRAQRARKVAGGCLDTHGKRRHCPKAS